ncbi:oxygen-independent coproporphyrinogen III oxidase [Candidatus Ichthyocystis hellenicum]|uniref:Heme chaperone HemW n=1 Tax=Candidatus Ichthyocystis hellenicum TaxID=1561003 RepID=A0A0S4M0M2_9BURK|nr:radical SAM family heme chaperone HemW [Candidatus Ichthyocystis hellenicum]CUT17278.1 oxygen-independent coproporphyrinogen III oxidase [Candidatus Ichthyocystis hellenicum]
MTETVGVNFTRRVLPPLSLYIHFPWCVRKCPYCDFNSHQLQSDLPEDAYIDALIRDLEFSLPIIWGRPIRSVFMGGGTPSLFSCQSMARLLSAVRARVFLLPDIEVTMEANPGVLFPERLGGYQDAGITRVSLGAQSFSSILLKAIGRIHSVGDIEKNLRALSSTTLIYNIDLMYGLPGQNVGEALFDLELALSFDPHHLSLYNLTLEQGTLFGVCPPDGIPSHDVCADMQAVLYPYLSDRNYERYEVSAFSRSGYQCQHNLNYWMYGDYIGIGAGAHSKLTCEQKIIRQARVRGPRKFMEQAGSCRVLESNAEISTKDRPFEFFMNALRLKDGTTWSLYEERTGLSRMTVLSKVDELVDKKLMMRDAVNVRATSRGWDFLNDILTIFLPEKEV